MPHMEENSVVLLSIIFKLVCGCGSILWSTVVGGFVPHVFLGWVLNLGNAKNRYSQLVSILARHLKYSVWHWNTRKLTWYSSNILWWIRTILKNLSCITSMITVQSTSNILARGRKSPLRHSSTCWLTWYSFYSRTKRREFGDIRPVAFRWRHRRHHRKRDSRERHFDRSGRD
jgi:hypothetical protein